jgi:hypothetical protein
MQRASFCLSLTGLFALIPLPRHLCYVQAVLPLLQAPSLLLLYLLALIPHD